MTPGCSAACAAVLMMTPAMASPMQFRIRSLSARGYDATIEATAALGHVETHRHTPLRARECHLPLERPFLARNGANARNIECDQVPRRQARLPRWVAGNFWLQSALRGRCSPETWR